MNSTIILSILIISIVSIGTNFAFATIPDPPTNLTTTQGNGQVELTWIIPNNTGSSNITNYNIEFRVDAGSWELYETITITSEINSSLEISETVHGLTNGTKYFFRVSAENDSGASKFSRAKSATPGTPDAPTGLTATPGNGQVTLKWNAPSDNGSSITNYHILYKKDSINHWILSKRGDDTTTIVRGLTNDESWKFKIYAKNANGNGTSTSAVTATPLANLANAPDAPSGLSTTPGNQQVKLSWNTPSSNGSPITHYIIEYRSDSNWLSYATLSTATSATVSNLQNGTKYEFRVFAVNSVNVGKHSSIESATPGTPGVPTYLRASSHNNHVILNWAAPSGNGSPLTGSFLVYREVGSHLYRSVQSESTTSFFIPYLQNGKLYEFSISAKNANGIGPAAGPVFATPGPPGQATGLSAIPDDSYVTIFWSNPPGKGANITHIVAEFRSDSKWSSRDIYSTGTVGIIWGLKNNTEYEIRVSAANDAGKGIPSKSIFVTPSGPSPPSAPANLKASPSSHKISLSWDIPLQRNPQIVDYHIQYSTGGSDWKTVSDGYSKNRHFTMTGLTNGTEYEFRVRAVNIDGDVGPWTSVSAIPAIAPGAPTSLSATKGKSLVQLAWFAPKDNGGSKIIDYIIEYKSGNGSWQTYNDGIDSNTYSIVRNLTNGTTYDFRVSAKNPADTGIPSGIASATPATTPGAPIIYNTETDDGEMTLSWFAPKDNGGSPITHYKIYYRTQSVWSSSAHVTTSDTFVTITGLDSKFYVVTVAAVNDMGEGERSKRTMVWVP